MPDEKTKECSICRWDHSSCRIAASIARSFALTSLGLLASLAAVRESRRNARRVQLDLFYDYRTSVALYPQWQALLREKQPKTLVFWGQDDIFFTREGGEAYLKDLPQAEMHRLDSGHFAVEDCLAYISSNIKRFYLEEVTEKSS